MSTLSERITAPTPGFTADIKADDFVALCRLVRRLCGVDLLQYKRGQMERRVRTFAQRRGTPDLLAYGVRLQADKEELDAFLDRVTINVSHLWRHEDQWTALGKTILPELAARGRVRCWSRGVHAGGRRERLDRRHARGDPRHRPGSAHGRARQDRHVHRRGRPDRAEGAAATLVRACR
jgi:chemotaxis protein methyltransferase CheR